MSCAGARNSRGGWADGGRLTVRERIDAVLDPGSFHEIGAISGKAEYGADNQLRDQVAANCVFGRGKVDGRPVVVVGDDFTVRGGSADATIKEKPLMARGGFYARLVDHQLAGMRQAVEERI